MLRSGQSSRTAAAGRWVVSVTRVQRVRREPNLLAVRRRQFVIDKLLKLRTRTPARHAGIQETL